MGSWQAYRQDFWLGSEERRCPPVAPWCLTTCCQRLESARNSWNIHIFLTLILVFYTLGHTCLPKCIKDSFDACLHNPGNSFISPCFRKKHIGYVHIWNLLLFKVFGLCSIFLKVWQSSKMFCVETTYKLSDIFLSDKYFWHSRRVYSFSVSSFG